MGGQTLAELTRKARHGLHPSGQETDYSRSVCPPFPQDKMQVIATDEELNIFGKEMDGNSP